MEGYRDPNVILCYKVSCFCLSNTFLYCNNQYLDLGPVSVSTSLTRGRVNPAVVGGASLPLTPASCSVPGHTCFYQAGSKRSQLGKLPSTGISLWALLGQPWRGAGSLAHSSVGGPRLSAVHLLMMLQGSGAMTSQIVLSEWSRSSSSIPRRHLSRTTLISL